MTESVEAEESRPETTTTDMYLPAVSTPPKFDRIESVLSDLFGFHGVVLIPENYNK